MSPGDGDIRRRNVRRDIIIVNKSALVGEFIHILKMHGDNNTKLIRALYNNEQIMRQNLIMAIICLLKTSTSLRTELSAVVHLEVGKCLKGGLT
jgi:hypothetical protein